jgi:hypothetical protein
LAELMVPHGWLPSPVEVKGTLIGQVAWCHRRNALPRDKTLTGPSWLCPPRAVWL